MLTFVKLGALLLLFGLGYRYVVSDVKLHLTDLEFIGLHRRHAMRVLYPASLLVIYMTGLLAPFFFEGAALRVGLVLYCAASSVAAVIHRNITGSYSSQRAYFDEDTVEILVRESNMWWDAIVAYRGQLVWPVLAALAIAAILAAEPSGDFRIGLPLGLALTAAVVLLAMLVAREKVFIHGPGSPFSFPFFFIVPIRLFRHLRNRDVHLPKRLQPVTMAVEGSKLKKIVFIMDESVRGDYLTLGRADLETTPVLAGLGDELINFGVALSSHNCSSYSRYLLRYGARICELPSSLEQGLNLPGPTIWQYARAAGYRTVYIDGFSNALRLHSGMTLQEADLIDDYRRIIPAAPHERDRGVLESLIEALADPAPAFIYVDKYGLHRPYEDKFPTSEAVFDVGAAASPAERLQCDYKNGVRWCVDAFFRDLLDSMDLTATAIFYTSDHGQSLLEGGYSLSHCSVGDNVVAGEALVPLFAIVEDSALRARLATSAESLLNKASHFEIFPTLLIALGFAEDEVRLRYPDTLFGKALEWPRFLTGFKRNAVWTKVR